MTGITKIPETEDQLVDELMSFSLLSTTWLQRKYKLSYDGAMSVKKKWEERQPKDPSFEERLAAFLKNPTVKKHPPKKRKTPFFINGKMLHTWIEAQKELNEIQERA